MLNCHFLLHSPPSAYFKIYFIVRLSQVNQIFIMDRIESQITTIFSTKLFFYQTDFKFKIHRNDCAKEIRKTCNNLFRGGAKTFCGVLINRVVERNQIYLKITDFDFRTFFTSFIEIFPR